MNLKLVPNRIAFAQAGMFLFLLVVFGGVAESSVASGQVCDRAASEAARRTGIPVSILKALTRTETGRRKGGVFSPWPWSINVEGKGQWFSSRAEAEVFLHHVMGKGVRNFDVGCFQINYRWHGTAFSGPKEMFDPNANALYAARFLKRLFEEKGDWIEAAAAYHSRTPKYAKRYKSRFERILENLPSGPNTQRMVQVASQPKMPYPLLPLTEGKTFSPGSLVPIATSAKRSWHFPYTHGALRPLKFTARGGHGCHSDRYPPVKCGCHPFGCRMTLGWKMLMEC